MMPLPLRKYLTFVAALIGLASIGHAQLLTVNTISGGYVTAAGHASGAILADGTAITQTFTGITSIDTLTFRFIASNPAGGASLDVYFSEWSALDATASLGAGSFTLPTQPTWTADGGLFYYDMALDLSSLGGSLTALNTYALTIVGNASTAAGNYRIGLGDVPYGVGTTLTHTGVTNFSNLTSSGASFGGAQFAFLGDSSSGYDAFAPVPEASTIAVLFAGAFVGLMATRRVRQRRQQLALSETA